MSLPTPPSENWVKGARVLPDLTCPVPLAVSLTRPQVSAPYFLTCAPVFVPFFGPRAPQVLQNLLKLCYHRITAPLSPQKKEKTTQMLSFHLQPAVK